MIKLSKSESGFTIVEMVMVVVIIGILAAVTLVSYFGVQEKATVATITSDLDGASKQIKIFQAINKDYPTSVDDCPNPSPNINICLKVSPGNLVSSYLADNVSRPRTFSLVIENTASNIKYKITKDTAVEETFDTICPSGFIVVPGNINYETNDFCVMKYEAKMANSTTPVSVAAGAPWSNISQDDANLYSPNVAGCPNCGLMTESEWMTIAKNVISVSTNWSDSTVGVGYIFSGHNDSSPNNKLDASTNDSNGYYLTGDAAPSSQRRTLTLTNGEVIWDFAGNLSEWTTAQLSSGQPGIAGAGADYREWTAITAPGTLSPDASPSFLSIPGSENWNSVKGIGKVYGDSDSTTLRAHVRSGNYSHGNIAGVLALILLYDNTSSSIGLGFRVATPGLTN